uniref:RIIa domain-containing protein n=1 Tax=Schistosoma mansoni TaxID=6183 RepID=A0A5K4ESV8_SCHMA
MAVPFSNTTLRVPHGFPNLLEGFAREVLRHQPKDIYGFGAKYFEELLLKREETGTEDLAQLGAKLNDRYYNNKAYCTGTCNINNPEHQEAAVRIQAEYRRHLASQETEHLREENAATRIQANYRGYRDRKLVNVMKENERNMYHSGEQPNKEDEILGNTSLEYVTINYLPLINVVIDTIKIIIIIHIPPNLYVNLESVRDIDQTSVLSNHTISPNNQSFEENKVSNQLSQSQKYTEHEAAIIIQSRYRGHLQRERFHSTTKIKRIFINNDDSNDDIVTENDVVIDQTSSSSHHHRHPDSIQSPIESKEIDTEEKVSGKESLNTNKPEEDFRTSDDEISSHQEEKNLESDKQITNDYFIENSNENTTEDISIANNTESEHLS